MLNLRNQVVVKNFKGKDYRLIVEKNKLFLGSTHGKHLHSARQGAVIITGRKTVDARTFWGKLQER